MVPLNLGAAASAVAVLAELREQMPEDQTLAAVTFESPPRSRWLLLYGMETCRCWCRLRGNASFISFLNWTEVGPKFWDEPL
jgi:hypothetical protein